MTDYAYKDGKKYVWPVAMRSKFNGVGGWHKLTDAQRAEYGWYPVQYANEQYTPGEQVRDVLSQELVDGVYHIVYQVSAIDISVLVAEAKNTAQSIRNDLMYKGLEYMGGVFKTDAISAAEVHGQSMFYALPDDNPSTSPDAEWLLPHPAGHGGRWRTMDNGFVSMTLEEFHGLSKRLREYERNVSQQAHKVKDDLLPACTTKAEIDQVLEDFRNYVA